MELERDDRARAAARHRPLRSLGFLSAGTLIAILGAALRERSEPRPDRGPAPSALWVADRDAGQIYALDSRLILQHRWPCSDPLALAARRDGGLWVLRSGRDEPDRRPRLEHWSAGGERIAMVGLDPCADLDRSAADDALVIESASAAHTDRALSIEGDGSLSVLCERAGLTCIASSPRSVALGTSDGEVLCLDPARAGSIAKRFRLGGSIADLAAGPDAETWWVLDVGQTRRLFLLDGDLHPRWTSAIDVSAAHLAPVPGQERMWLCDTLEPRLCRWGPGGTLELEVIGLPLAGLDRACAWGEGGVLAAAPGAILQLDAEGHPRPGQGGFNFLTDLARAR
jgi:hypothetical protein